MILTKETFCIATPRNLRSFLPNFPLALGSDEEFFRVKLFCLAQNM